MREKRRREMGRDRKGKRKEEDSNVIKKRGSDRERERISERIARHKKDEKEERDKGRGFE